MKQLLDLKTWVRKEHFHFFKNFEEPFYSICVPIDCTRAYHFAKENGISFFLYYLHQSLTAAQLIKPFKYRIEEDEVFIYDQINGGSTIPRTNGTFGFGYFYYHALLEEFILEADKEIDHVKNTTDLTRSTKNDLIRYSALPWLNFTSLSHARSFAIKDSCPKISFGKMMGGESQKSMPVSIHVHHALVDGLHVGQYVDCFQELMNKGV